MKKNWLSVPKVFRVIIIGMLIGASLSFVLFQFFGFDAKGILKYLLFTLAILSGYMIVYKPFSKDRKI